MTTSAISDLPYRPCVGIMVLNSANKVWIGRRINKGFAMNTKDVPGKWWQMPQGGIDAGEDPAVAARRELAEETGIVSADIIGEAPRWLNYDLPADVIGIRWKNKYRGQTQRWFALRFTGDDDEINIAPEGEKPEFDAWRWADASELDGLIVPFKREVYSQVISIFEYLWK